MRWKTFGLIPISMTILMAGCGKDEGQKQYEGLSKEQEYAKKVISDKQDVSKVEQNSIQQPMQDKVTTEEPSADDLVRKSLGEKERKKQLSQSKKYKIFTGTADHPVYLKKLKKMDKRELEDYALEALQERKEDNLGQESELESIYLPETDKEAKTDIKNEIRNKIFDSYAAAKEAKVYDGTSDASIELGETYFGGETSIEPYAKMLRTGMTLDMSDIRVVNHDGDYNWMAELKTPVKKTGAVVFGSYDKKSKMLTIFDSAVTLDGKPYFDENAKRSLIFYGIGRDAR